MTRAVQALRARARGFPIGGIGVAVLAVLVGWWIGTLVLAWSFPSFSSAQSAAAPFLPIGIAIALLGDERPSRARRVALRALAGLVAAIGLLGLLALWLRDTPLHGTARAVVSLLLDGLDAAGLDGIGAPSLVLIAAALVAHDDELALFPPKLASGLTALPAVAALVMFVSQLYGVGQASAIGEPSPALVSACVGIILASSAILAARPGRGLMRLMTSSGAAGHFLRGAFPAAIAVPIGLGALCLAAERSGHYAADVGSALRALAEIVCILGMVVWSALVLHRSQAAQRAELEQLREREDDLRITLDSLGGGVIATDAAGRVTHMSAEAEWCTGRTLRETAGRRIDDAFRMVDRDTRHPVESPFDHVARKGSAERLAKRAVVLGPEGTERAVLKSGAPILNRLGILRGVVLVVAAAHGITRSGGR